MQSPSLIALGAAVVVTRQNLPLAPSLVRRGLGAGYSTGSMPTFPFASTTSIATAPASMPASNVHAVRRPPMTSFVGVRTCRPSSAEIAVIVAPRTGFAPRELPSRSTRRKPVDGASIEPVSVLPLRLSVMSAGTTSKLGDVSSYGVVGHGHVVAPPA